MIDTYSNDRNKYNTFEVVKQYCPEFANSKTVLYGLDWVKGQEETAPHQVADCLASFLSGLIIQYLQEKRENIHSIKNCFLAVEEIANSRISQYDSEQFCYEFFDWIEQDETDTKEFALFFRDQLLPSTQLKWEEWNKNNWVNRVWKKYFDLED